MLKKILSENNHDAIIASIGYKTSTTGAGIGVFGWLTSQEGMTFIGVSVAVAGFFVSWYYNHKRNQRENAEHVLRMKELCDECGVDDVK